ncbi:hypothetical protein SAMN04488693_14510 [Arthrobacter subterraneus]|uniref:DUF7793 domain-containing protein n=1 Tax=Arthrobacter subterraneus TaxID=335973 RepID=A0A1G8Q8I4_9MICC|nr:hypothetical protein [Arthrobacter subterraneus]SDJ01011.1 hypothetical protein SAMN04488693_14510 [Arthrobacter subterraneus]
MQATQVNPFQLQLHSAGYIRVRWQPGRTISETDAHAVTDAITALTPAAAPAPGLLVDMGQPTSISAGARAVFLTARGAPRVALLGNSPMDRVMAAFALNSDTPTQFFLTETEAITWLTAN